MNAPRHLGHRVGILSQAIRQAIDRKLCDLDLTVSSRLSSVICPSDRGEVVYPKDIEQRFHLTHPTVSGSARPGWRQKASSSARQSPDDRRCKRVSATEKAEQCQPSHPQHVPRARAGDPAKLQPRGGADAAAPARPGDRKSIRR